MKTQVILSMPFRCMGDFVAMALRHEGAFEVAAVVTQGQEILDWCAKLPGVLVITDLKLPDMLLADLIRRLRSGQPDARVLVFSKSTNIPLTREVLEARPHGFAHLSEPMEEFLQILGLVKEGKRSYSPFASRVQDIPSDGGNGRHVGKPALSDRELGVLKLVALGKSSKEIGVELQLAPKTVDDYRGKVMSKLNIHDVVGLTHYALKHKLVSLEDGKLPKPQLA